VFDAAIILAGGQGRKFFPFEEVRNKCAFPIANEPIVRRLVRQVQSLGIKQIYIVTDHQAGSVRDAVRGLENITYLPFMRATAGTAEATAYPVRSFAHDEPECRTKNLLVIYGDCVFYSDELRNFGETFEKSGADAAVLCAPLNGERPQDWIVAQLGDPIETGGNALHGIEGHGRGGSHRIAGAFAIKLSALPYLESQPRVMRHVPVGGMPLQEAELADSLATMLDDGLSVIAVETQHKSADVDKPWHIFDATDVVLSEMAENLTESRIDPTAEISDGAEITGHIVVEAGAKIGNRVVIEGPCWIGKNSKVINGAIIKPRVMIGANTRVSDYCLVGGDSVIGNGCVIGHGAEFDGVMLDGAYIYHYSEIYGVLGAAVDIGAATVCGTLRFDDTETVHKIRGRREFPKSGADAAFFGDYSRTGVNVITQPGVKIGAYSCVGAGIVLYDDVPSRKLRILKQETIERDWGPERYGW